jgi:hypothetical protein
LRDDVTPSRQVHKRSEALRRSASAPIVIVVEILASQLGGLGSGL